MAERPLHIILQFAQCDFAHIHDDRARFDLGEIQNVIDQRQQIVAGGMNGLGELDLFGERFCVLVLGKLVGKDQQAVQRRAQLVRHVGQEFGLVLGSQRQLLGFFFQRLAGLFHFAVLAFHFHVLVGQQFRLFSQLLVGLLQFLLLALQFLGQGLRLLEQILRAGVGLDGVQHDADTFGQLIQKGLVRRAEAVEGSQFDDRLDLAFKDDGQDQHIERMRFAQAGADRDVIRGHW
jgi:hypothetical protein